MSKQEKSTRKRLAAIALVIIVGALVLGILWYQGSQYQSPSTKPSQVSSYVVIQYKAIGWFYSSWIAGISNETYFLIDVTVINDGYTKPVLCHAWSAYGGFNLTINGVTYGVWGLGTIPAGLYNGTKKPGEVIPTNFASKFSALPDVSLADKAQASGTIAFQLPTNPQTFSLNYSTNFNDYSLPDPEVKIVQKG